MRYVFWMLALVSAACGRDTAAPAPPAAIDPATYLGNWVLERISIEDSSCAVPRAR